MTETSWNNRMANEVSPTRVWVRLRSLSICMTRAVDDMASAMPTASEPCHVWPSSSPVTMKASDVTVTWALPRPRMARRMRHNTAGSSSMPIRNIIMITPISATSATLSGWAISDRPKGPMTTPAIR